MREGHASLLVRARYEGRERKEKNVHDVNWYVHEALVHWVFSCFVLEKLGLRGRAVRFVIRVRVLDAGTRTSLISTFCAFVRLEWLFFSRHVVVEKYWGRYSSRLVVERKEGCDHQRQACTDALYKYVTAISVTPWRQKAVFEPSNSPRFPVT